MHPLLARPWRLLLVVASAALAGVPLAWLLRVLEPRPWGAALAFALPMQVFYSFIALSASWVCRRHPMRGDAAWSALAAPFCAALPAPHARAGCARRGDARGRAGAGRPLPGDRAGAVRGPAADRALRGAGCGHVQRAPAAAPAAGGERHQARYPGLRGRGHDPDRG